MRKIFTRAFCDLSTVDQAAVVNAAVLDLEMALGQVNPAGRRSIQRAIRRIERKATEYGVYGVQEDVPQ
jgi:hypothetical protein